MGAGRGGGGAVVGGFVKEVAVVVGVGGVAGIVAFWGCGCCYFASDMKVGTRLLGIEMWVFLG